jgi:lysophospholipid acyltransferase (LPLAT)-like uncharacterized protein
VKIRSRGLIRTLAWLGAAVGRALFRSVRTVVRPALAGTSPYEDTGDERFLYCAWHDAVIGLVFSGKPVRMAGLVSRHADGSYIADAMEMLGIAPIRGSSRKGGAEALRQMFDAAREYHIAIATDGPQGPCRTVKEGIVYLASQTGRAIVPVAYAARSAWRPRGRWTHMTVPLPFTSAWLYGGEPIRVPSGLSRNQLEPYRIAVQRAMDALQQEVEQLARGLQRGEGREQQRRAA